jgi:ribose-phosphate pyrophosphokinase
MRIDLNRPERGDIALTWFTFPDGQPHCDIDASAIARAAAQGPIDVVTSIQSGNDLLRIGLALDALKSVPCEPAPWVRLNISYLLGARMDRRIAPAKPATLAVVASVLSGWSHWIDELHVLDAHSAVSHALLPLAQALLPDALLQFTLAELESEAMSATARPVLVIPDAGAVPRVEAMVQRLKLTHTVAECVKKRDSKTGKLSGFELTQGDVTGRVALIVDDICDGGGTFAGIAKVLRAAGAIRVVLCVTHGVFSKGLVIDGIDSIYCTDSYQARALESAAIDAADLTCSTETRQDFSALRVRRGDTVILTQLQNFVANLLSPTAALRAH